MAVVEVDSCYFTSMGVKEAFESQSATVQHSDLAGDTTEGDQVKLGRVVKAVYSRDAGLTAVFVGKLAATGSVRWGRVFTDFATAFFELFAWEV